MSGARTDKTWKICSRCHEEFPARSATICRECMQKPIKQEVYKKRKKV